MYVLTKILFALLLLILCSLEGESDCILSLHEDFGNPSPVYIRDRRYLAPNYKGDITVKRTEQITVACPGEYRAVVFGNSTSEFSAVDVECVTDSTFKTENWEGRFRDIGCSSAPWVSVEGGKECYGKSQIYKVGYKVDGKFYSLYEVCFNRKLARTLYVMHSLRPVAKFTQGGRRPDFIEGGLFGKVRMSEAFKYRNQKLRLNAVLGDGAAKRYISDREFLTRGHLAPRADFPLRAEQRATYQYANTAPQWLRNNAGDWASLEEGLRRHTHELNSVLTVYTGTFGVLTLPDRKKKEQELYLTTDENNNGIVPVPLYFFKLVHSPSNKTATAFVTINCSFFNKTAAERLTFCTDVCAGAGSANGDTRFSWLRWRKDGAKSFCCSYDDLVHRVKYLPKVNAKRGLFY